MPLNRGAGVATEGADQASDSPDSANPFDEPLASEKAEADHAAATKPLTRKTNRWAADAGSKVPGITYFGNTVTPKQAAGGVAAGAAVGAAPSYQRPAAPVMRHIATEYGQPAMCRLSRVPLRSHPLVAKLITHALETAAGMKMADYMGAFGK